MSNNRKHYFRVTYSCNDTFGEALVAVEKEYSTNSEYRPDVIHLLAESLEVEDEAVTILQWWYLGDKILFVNCK